MSRYSVTVHDSAALSREIVDQISDLKDRIWSFGVSRDDMYAVHQQRNVERARRQALLIQHGDALLAHAELFEREVFCAGKPLRVGALAGVCVQPERQGGGLGKQIVRRAFASVDDGDYPLLLFQTGVPEFYHPLGARPVSNRFYDSRAAAVRENPWWEDVVMIYPTPYDWPLADVDLNGPGY